MIYEACYLGRPWTELDYCQAMTTRAPIYVQLKSTFPEVVAVNALYTHGLSSLYGRGQVRGAAKSIGMRVLSTPHGLGYATIVIENVDPFDLNHVMWAISVKVNPAQDVMIFPNLSVNQLTRPANRNRAKQCNPNVEGTSNTPQKNREDRETWHSAIPFYRG